MIFLHFIRGFTIHGFREVKIKKKVEIFGKDAKKINSKQLEFDSNQMYIDEIVEMVEFMKGEQKQWKILAIAQAIKDLKIVEGKNG